MLKLLSDQDIGVDFDVHEKDASVENEESGN